MKDNIDILKSIGTSTTYGKPSNDTTLTMEKMREKINKMTALMEDFSHVTNKTASEILIMNDALLDTFDKSRGIVNDINSAHLKVFCSKYLTETVQTKFPRCNKKKIRIVKKFRKKYTKEVPINGAFIVKLPEIKFQDRPRWR